MKADAFLTPRFLRGWLFIIFCLPLICSVASDHSRKLGSINDMRQEKMHLRSSEENLSPGSAQNTYFFHF